jgi:integrase
VDRVTTQASADKATATDKRRELRDSKVPGLSLIVQPTGSKSWVLRYRFNTIRRKHTLASFDKVSSVADARELARAALLDIARGNDPAKMRTDARERANDKSDTFAAKVPEFLNKYVRKKRKPSKKTTAERARMLGVVRKGDDWEPRAKGLTVKWGEKKVSEITQEMVCAHVESIAETHPIKANRTLAALHVFFKWTKVSVNPAKGIEPPGEESVGERILLTGAKYDPTELRWFWHATLKDKAFGPLFRMLLLTAQRRGEVEGMRWDELDLQNRMWVLPGHRVKNRTKHYVPLNDAAMQIIAEQPRVANSPYVFTLNGKSPLRIGRYAKRRLDKAMLKIARAERGDGFSIEDWVTHDLRRTAATGMRNKCKADAIVIEKILNHSGSFGGVWKVYQKDDFMDERQTALDAWGRYVLTTTGEPSNVVQMSPLKRATA